jgi:hypothetical protein
MLLITVAPVVSQLLAAYERSYDVPVELCSVHTPSSGSPGHQAPDKFNQFDGQACGYCHFFSHTPVAHGVGSVSALEVDVLQTVAAQIPRSNRATRTFTVAQPRAPPVPLS